MLNKLLSSGLRRRNRLRHKAIPFFIGILHAQTPPAAPVYTYDAVSIRQSAPGQTSENFGKGPAGGLQTRNTSVMNLLIFAYDVRDYQFVGAPRWVLSDRYDVVLTPDHSDTAFGPDTPAKEASGWVDRTRQRVQAVLRDRFGLVLRAEIRELPVYALRQTAKGAKISRADGGHPATFHNNGRGHVESIGAPIKFLTSYLSSALGRPVNDETGLTGQYDFKLDWTPDSKAGDVADNSTVGPSVFTALTDQLGLRLESGKAPVQVFVVEKIERPSEN